MRAGTWRRELAGLPTQRPPESLEAKQFDLLVLSLQLCLLGGGTGFPKLRQRLVEIAAALEEQVSIPVVAAQMPLIQEVQTDTWWQDVTVVLLEPVRKRLRGLVHLIEHRRRAPIYTDFEDEIGDAAEIAFDQFAPQDAFAKFRAKARHFLRQHQDHVAVHKLRSNRQLTPTDLEELERMLRESGTGTAEDVARAKADTNGLGLFVRSLVGLDRAAAKEAFAEFLAGRTMTANQMEFVGLVVDHLTENGMVDAGRLYESPYTDLNPMGVDGLFADDAVGELVSVLDEVSAPGSGVGWMVALSARTPAGVYCSAFPNRIVSTSSQWELSHPLGTGVAPNCRRIIANAVCLARYR